MYMISLDEQEFSKKVYDITGVGTFNGIIPAVVLFHTSGKYCEELIKLFETVEALYMGRVNFYTVDVDAQTEFAKKLHLRAIPTSMFIPITNKQPILAVGLFNTTAEIERALSRITTSKPLITTM
jgi:thioredoxin 1